MMEGSHGKARAKESEVLELILRPRSSATTRDLVENPDSWVKSQALWVVISESGPKNLHFQQIPQGIH